jgi:hypothetical protein
MRTYVPEVQLVLGLGLDARVGRRMRADVTYRYVASAISTEKRRDERLVLVRHQSGLMNKFGRIRVM